MIGMKGWATRPASNRVTLTDPESGATHYTYDTLNRLTGLNDFQSHNFTFSYDALSRRTQLTRPNGVNTNYSYDNVSHLLSVLHQVGSTTVDGASYTYDSAGNRTAKTDQASSVTSNYGYDAIYQLTGVSQGSTTTESYTYDVVGNRLSSLGVSPYAYNSSNQLTSTPSTTYTYDSNGSTKTKVDSSGTTTYNWDYVNQLSSVVLPASGGTVSFKYDPFGRRIQKSAPSGTVNYLYDGGNLIEEVDNGGNVLARYTEGFGYDQPFSVLRSGTTSYYNSDVLNSVTSLSNSAGSLANAYTYDSFGRLTASTGTVTNLLRYSGRELDAESGVYYYRARFYDPATGRFISEDPVGFAGGLNLYEYASNDPVDLSDPFGLSPQSSPGCKKNCPTVPTHPGYADINHNIREARRHPFAFYSFYNLVHNNGPWDYKQNKVITDFAYGAGRPMDPQSPYEDFGNFNFGATAAAEGIPEDVALRGAGWASTQADPTRADQWGHWWGKKPYGDDPNDQVQIMLGYQYYRNGCYQ